MAGGNCREKGRVGIAKPPDDPHRHTLALAAAAKSKEQNRDANEIGLNLYFSNNLYLMP